ncbi:MAG: hypothetical protein JWM05_282, partial [Acidimicrobiales bacterium]|nr:hypothetical protein [Acidimicrobiales bacterium]
LGVLPVLATWGDSLLHLARVDAGAAGGWAGRPGAPAAMAPARLVRNVVVSVARAAPTLAVAGVLLGGWYALERLPAPATIVDLTLRSLGALLAGVLVIPAARGSARFQTGPAVDRLVARFLDQRGRAGQQGLVLWLVAAFFVASALWLSPEVWPLPR